MMKKLISYLLVVMLIPIIGIFINLLAIVINISIGNYFLLFSNIVCILLILYFTKKQKLFKQWNELSD